MLNFKFALRTLFKTPFVTTIAVLSLAFGIGANTAIFSLFNQLFEVSGTDPIVFASAFVLLSLVAMLAGFVPAQRASKVNPMQALRCE